MAQVFCYVRKQQRPRQGLLPIWLDAPIAALITCKIQKFLENDLVTKRSGCLDATASFFAVIDKCKLRFSEVSKSSPAAITQAHVYRGTGRQLSKTYRALAKGIMEEDSVIWMSCQTY